MQEIVWEYFNQYGRDMPWRHPEPDGQFDPYKILISEIMLQQTQVNRVIPKYQLFLKEFPTIQSLAVAPLSKVLMVWSGLGYNRRAKFLQQTAQQLTQRPFPNTLEELIKLPGIGHNTAAAIMNYAYNLPTPFIETNIRTVYIHHYFEDQVAVNDRQLLPLVKETIDQEHPREWFWALMDYGAYLKSSVGNLNRQSQHYTKQANFKGSRRQLRGQLLRLLVIPQSINSLKTEVVDERLQSVVVDLQKEGLIVERGGVYSLPD